MALHIPLVSQAELEAGATADGTPLPTIPIPASPGDLPPDVSPPIVIGTTEEQLMYYWDWDHGNVQIWIPGPPAPQQIPGHGMTDSFYGPFPTYTLTHRRYWTQVDYQQVSGAGHYTRSETTTEGMSSTESSSISAELGVGVDGLSAKLSATFEQSITVSQESTVTNSWAVTGTAGQTTIWILWQLIDEFVALDANGNVVGGWPYGTCGAYIQMMPPFGVNTPGNTSLPTARVTQGLRAYAANPTLFPEATSEAVA
jgi:hypothetical protein